ncbi:MAG: GyrI-like domain-containing protein [Saprospiraceae bacterium]
MKKSTILEIQEFKVVGISVRTTNENERSQKDIGELWGKFMGQNIIDQIPNKDSLDIYCIYTDYESDFNSPYTTILGCRVKSFDNIPDDFISLSIPTAKYRVYNSTGKLPDCVVMTWINIWQSGIERKFIADFDLYGQSAQDREHAKIETYVSI